MILPTIPILEKITTQLRPPNPQLMELLLADRPLTAEEWAEITAIEEQCDE